MRAKGDRRYQCVEFTIEVAQRSLYERSLMWSCAREVDCESDCGVLSRSFQRLAARVVELAERRGVQRAGARGLCSGSRRALASTEKKSARVRGATVEMKLLATVVSLEWARWARGSVGSRSQECIAALQHCRSWT